MAKKWQIFAATQRKRILFPKENRFSSSTLTISLRKAENGCFVVYSADLLKMSEEEFGLPCEGPIILPVEGRVLNYIIEMIKRGLAEDIQRALLMSISITRFSLPSLHQELRNCPLLVY